MKKKQNISFRLVSFTDAAGKYSPEAFRCGNEDNFFVNYDLTDNTTNRVSQDEVLQLGELGMLMVVADGMGGMNAGEVASQIAIDIVKTAFSSALLSDSVIATSQSRQRYLEQVIKQADKEIKFEAHKDNSRENMGSTIIIGWLFNDELTISWCGDSRAYIFNEKSGIRLISQDHSYVQELVNKGLLTYDQTFDHPQNNIVTRSLGDPTKDARPESRTYNIGKEDVILICSDGLSGVLRDRKTFDCNGKLLPEENIEDIIRAHTSSMKECREALWVAAEKEGWYDNVTAILCQIIEGPESHWGAFPFVSKDNCGNKKTRFLFIIGILIAITIAVAYFIGKESHRQIEYDSNLKDSTSVKNIDSTMINFNNSTSDIVIDKTVNNTVDRQSVQEQIIKQANENHDSIVVPNGLTKIEKRDSSKNNRDNSNGKLTPIENKFIRDNINNPIAPTDNKKDNIIDNPLTN